MSKNNSRLDDSTFKKESAINNQQQFSSRRMSEAQSDGLVDIEEVEEEKGA